jgi:hypothetical protein
VRAFIGKCVIDELSPQPEDMSIPRREDLPEDFYAMRNMAVSLPRLAPDSAANCPVFMKEILEYLDYEAPGGENSGSASAGSQTRSLLVLTRLNRP